MMKAQPGDRIVVTNEAVDRRRIWPDNVTREDLRSKSFVVMGDCGNPKGTIAVQTTETGGVFLKHGDYTVLPRTQERSIDLYVSPQVWKDICNMEKWQPEPPKRTAMDLFKDICNLTSREKVKLGDTVAITDKSYGSLNGIHCTVVKGDFKPMVLKDEPGCIRVTSPYLDHYTWLRSDQYKVVQQSSSSAVCPDCKGTGRVELLTSTVDCDCVKNTITKKQKSCENCSYEYCECTGGCLEANGGGCSRCGVWCCGDCLMDSVCGSCYSKIQGGVN